MADELPADETPAQAALPLGLVPFERLPPARLPMPERSRFQPLRAGILNLWQYDDQELWFHQGRLILRGENGSGKSKALELLLPFLLDADLSPQRLDPFASTARSMRWNLLGDDRVENGLGYVWLELGRRGTAGDETGAETAASFLTLGCGLKASRRRDRVEAWYFLTTQRVGAELALVSPSRLPLSKELLRESLGAEGQVFESSTEYRARLDALVFRLGEERFAALRHLLLRLRRPHLSENLDPDQLSALLAESLPPLDPDLIGQLSGDYERLENDQRELARIESSGAAVRAFLEVYREYGRGVARGRATEMRQADSRDHTTAGEVRKAEEGGERSRAALALLRRRLEESEQAMVEGRATVRALEQSEAMRKVEALRLQRTLAERLREQARRDEEANRQATQSFHQREEEAKRAASEAERDDEAAQRGAETAGAAARGAGLEGAHEAAREAVTAAQPEAARGTVRAALQQREAGLRELLGLRREAELARTRHEEEEKRRQAALAQAEEARRRRRQDEEEVERARERLREALADWLSRLAELRVSPAEAEALLAAIEGEGPGRELGAAVLALAAPQRDAVIAARTELEAAEAALASEQARVTTLRDELARSRELPPEPPRTRAADRFERPGAPFYRLCEFRPQLEAKQRAGLEAALEAAGLLDAWVSPGGGLLPAGTLDSVLLPSPHEGAGTLADWLEPAAGHGIEAEEVWALLRSIEVGEVEADDRRPHRVSPDGGFRLGPLAGRWSKPEAEHVGAGAREAARRRRLAELESELARLDDELAALAGRQAALRERLRRMADELSRLPADAELRQAEIRAESAAADERRRLDELAEAERLAARARAAREEAELQLERRAKALSLAAWLGDLESYREALAAYERAATAWLTAWIQASRAREEAGTRTRRAEEARVHSAEAQRRAGESEREARAARAEYEALEAAVGVEAAEVIARHARESQRLRELESEHKGLREGELAAVSELAQIEERERGLRRDLAAHDADRDRAVFRLHRFGGTGLLPLVLDEVPSEPPEEWTLTRCLDLARAIEQRTSAVDSSEEAVRRRANRLYERYQALGAELGAEFMPSLEPDEELYTVRVGHNNRIFDVGGLLAMLGEEERRRRDLLAEEERQLFRRFLLGEVGDHLRKRLRQARELVEEMNLELAACATASGLVLRLSWKPAEDIATSVREAVPLLVQSQELLSDADRGRLEGFFRSRITDVRQQSDAVPWRQYLLAALDYRLWFRFHLQRQESGEKEWKELTRRGHAASSGGEKAVALHLPLFAAAAAHYRSAHPAAPRLILLDEAFAGIDEGMRGRLMGLLVRFDLDFMMTSHDAWGCHEELPGVATYHLHRDPGLPGVDAIRFVWNGERLIQEPA